MPVLNQAFEQYIGKIIQKIRQKYTISQKMPILIGSVKTILPYAKSDLAQQKQSQAFTNGTIKAFEELEPTDWVAYDKIYHIGFPVGIGALKYYQAINDPKQPFPDTGSLMDIPDGADKKLEDIINHKDPFKYTQSELIARIKNWLSKKHQKSMDKKDVREKR